MRARLREQKMWMYDRGMGLKYRKSKRAGPCYSFLLKIITMLRKAHVGLMVLAVGIPQSLKSGLTYEHYELSQY